MLSIKNLTVNLETHSIINNLSLDVAPGSVHALMGPNGSGKSSLAHVIMGHPRYTISQGSITYAGHDITSLSPDKRAHLGIFVAFQHPYELPGVTVLQFLKEAYQARIQPALIRAFSSASYGGQAGTIEVAKFQELLISTLASVGLDVSFAHRAVNDGFSGGEKKRLEMVQMLLLQPSLVILDEIDSGLDVDGLSLIADAIKQMRNQNPTLGVIIITHYQRLFTYLQPDHVHIMHNGSLIHSGDRSLIHELERTGYQPFIHRIAQGSSHGLSV